MGGTPAPPGGNVNPGVGGLDKRRGVKRVIQSADATYPGDGGIPIGTGGPA
jgi:hypothetical protein